MLGSGFDLCGIAEVANTQCSGDDLNSSAIQELYSRLTPRADVQLDELLPSVRHKIRIFMENRFPSINEIRMRKRTGNIKYI